MNIVSRISALVARYADSPAALVVKAKGGIPSTFHELNHPWLQSFAIDLIVDVGANTGQFATTARRLFPEKEIVSLEPIPACYEYCRRRFASDRNFSIENLAASDTTGSVEFSVSADSGASSVLPMSDLQKSIFPASSKVTKIQVRTKLLDQILAAKIKGRRIFLKIDVQGFELAVLRGARETLVGTQVVLVESSFESFYEGQALFEDVYAHLVSAGFRFVYSFNIMRDASGRPMQGDFVFVRRPTAL
jgi:FkbM family methyltransferase